MVLIARKGPQ